MTQRCLPRSSHSTSIPIPRKPIIHLRVTIVLSTSPLRSPRTLTALDSALVAPAVRMAPVRRPHALVLAALMGGAVPRPSVPVSAPGGLAAVGPAVARLVRLRDGGAAEGWGL